TGGECRFTCGLLTSVARSSCNRRSRQRGLAVRSLASVRERRELRRTRVENRRDSQRAAPLRPPGREAEVVPRPPVARGLPHGAAEGGGRGADVTGRQLRLAQGDERLRRPRLPAPGPTGVTGGGAGLVAVERCRACGERHVADVEHEDETGEREHDRRAGGAERPANGRG